MDKERLEKVVGKCNLNDTDKMPIKLHFVEDEQFLTGYLTRFETRILDDFYDEEITRILFNLVGLKNKMAHTAGMFVTESWRVERSKLRAKLNDMDLEQVNALAVKAVNRFFKGKFTCRDGYDFARSPKLNDSLFKGLYNVDGITKGEAVSALTIMEELVYDIICSNSDKWDYEYIDKQTIRIIEGKQMYHAKGDAKLNMCDRVHDVMADFDMLKVANRTTMHITALGKLKKPAKRRLRMYVCGERDRATI